MTTYRDLTMHYTELISPAVLSGLDRAAEETYEHPRQAFKAAEWAILSCLETTELPSGKDELAEDVRFFTGASSRMYAEMLASAACSDAVDLMTHCENYVADAPIPDGRPLAQLLKDSKSTLLKPAQLRDDQKYDAGEKRVFFDLLNSPYFRKTEPIFGEPLDTLVRYGRTHDDRSRFEWQPAVDQWLKRRTGVPGRGCPAAHHVVTGEDGSRQTILHAFWDRLVDLAYPE